MVRTIKSHIWKIKAIVIFALMGWAFIIYWIVIANINGGIAYIDFNAKNEMLFETILFPIVLIFLLIIGVDVWARFQEYEIKDKLLSFLNIDLNYELTKLEEQDDKRILLQSILGN